MSCWTNEECLIKGEYTDKYGYKRYMFDIGKFYFDGNFNVVELPKNLRLYHGSVNLAVANVEFPLGPYYVQTNPNILSNEEKKELKKDIPIKKKLEIINSKAKYSPAWYGDTEIAKKYSSFEGTIADAVGIKCGSNCIFVYKLKSNGVFIDMTSAFNIHILLSTDLLSDEEKKALRIDYKLSDTWTINDEANCKDKICNFSGYNPIKRFKAPRMGRQSSRKTGYIIPAAICRIAKSLGYAGYIFPKTPYFKDDVPTGSVRFAEVVFCYAPNYLVRVYSNKLDWQYSDDSIINKELFKLVSDFKKYKTLNIDMHGGDLYEHSVWLALYLEQFIESGDPIVTGISKNMYKLLVFSGFLHDIGKAGDNKYIYYDKPNHPKIGFEYVTNEKPYYINNNVINIVELLKEIGFNETEIKIIAVIIDRHWDFGMVIKNLVQKNDVNAIINYVKLFNQDLIDTKLTNLSKEKQLEILSMLIAVSVADIKAMSPIRDVEKFRKLSGIIKVDKNYKEEPGALNIKSKYLRISNVPQIHKGTNAYHKFSFDKYAIPVKEMIENAFINDCGVKNNEEACFQMYKRIWLDVRSRNGVK